MYKPVSEEWPRREIFDFFSGTSNPFYMVTFRQDVTGVYDYVKARGLSFYYAMVYLCTQVLNGVEAFRYTIRDGEVYILDERAPSFTDLKKGSESFRIVTMPCRGDIDEFCRAAKERSAAQTRFLDPDQETDELIYISCLPWVDMTAATNERDMDAPGARDDSIPRVTWGRYTRVGGRLELGISIEVNHRLIDGVHIGRFAEELTRRINELSQEAAK